jgi:hypothetical protein
VSSSSRVEVFVKLVDELVDVWRPVLADRLHDDVYRISDQAYDRSTETWEFGPGDEVICELIESSDGRIFAAIARSR